MKGKKFHNGFKRLLDNLNYDIEMYEKELVFYILFRFKRILKVK